MTAALAVAAVLALLAVPAAAVRAYARTLTPPARAASPRPAPGKNPVPGAPASAAPTPPGGPAPAPVPAREPFAPVEAPAPGPSACPRCGAATSYSVRVFGCRGVRLYGPAGELMGHTPCQPARPDPLDLEIRDLFMREGR